MKALHLSAATLLLGLADPSGALTIGSAQGAAWIGQPLNLVVPLSIDSREAADGLCLEAEVRQGDSRIDDKRITLSLEPGSTPDTPRVHLRTTNAIVEPVVSVRLSAGCTFKSTRQYTLLADLPATPAVIAPPVRASAPAATGAARRAQADAFSDESAEGGAVRRSRPSSAASAAPPRTVPRKPAAASTPPNPDAARDAAALTRRQASAAPPVRRPQAPAKPPTVQPKPPAAASAAAPAPAPAAPPVTAATDGVSRLQIEPLTPNTPVGAAATARTDAAATTGGATSAPLRASAPVGAAPPAVGAAAGAAGAPATPQVAATAGAGTSAVPSAAPNPASAGAAVDAQALEREADRMKEMGEVLASLRAQSAQTQRLLLEMRSELAQAQASRYRNPLVYVLLALTGVLLLVVLLLWRSLRQARQAQWWSEEQAEAMAAQKRAHAPRATRLPRRGVLDDGPDADEEDDDDDELPVLTDVDDAVPSQAPAARRGALDAVGFDRALERSVNAEELFDVQQKAEFFMSLGKHEQAIGVLRDHVSANPGTSALVYLDLLNILHALGRTEDYARQAREFEERFNAEVPPFDAFDRQGRGLEHYPSVLARISDLWPGAGTAELIEEQVFRHPGVRGEVFDLLAYQELLLLHAVARDIAEHPAPVFVRAPAAHAAAPHFVATGPAAGTAGEDETVPMPYLPHVDRAAVPANMPEVDMDISALDRTAFQTLRAPVENLPPAPAPAPIDPHVIDFNPFDPDDDELKPGRFSIKR